MNARDGFDTLAPEFAVRVNGAPLPGDAAADLIDVCVLEDVDAAGMFTFSLSCYSTAEMKVKWIDDVSKLGRERQKQFLRYFNHLLEQAVRLRYIDAALLPIPDGEKDIALRLNKIADVAQQKAIIGELDSAAYYIERNAHAKMLFHALTIKLLHILKERTIVQIN